jgi:hypothetical protein
MLCGEGAREIALLEDLRYSRPQCLNHTQTSTIGPLFLPVFHLPRSPLSLAFSLSHTHTPTWAYQ